MGIREPVAGVHVWLVLWKAFRAVQGRASASIEATGLGVSDFAALEAILHKGPLPVNAIAEKVFLTSGSMTAAVDRLESKGLVERRADASDRRSRVVHLTPKGRTLIAAAFRDHAAALERAVEGLSQDERAELVRLLKALGQGAAGKLDAASGPQQPSPNRQKRR
jgi:MarR family 2-MHQ and catechol resistance regulon transcriptional repressor